MAKEVHLLTIVDSDNASTTSGRTGTEYTIACLGAKAVQNVKGKHAADNWDTEEWGAFPGAKKAISLYFRETDGPSEKVTMPSGLEYYPEAEATVEKFAVVDEETSERQLVSSTKGLGKPPKAKKAVGSRGA